MRGRETALLRTTALTNGLAKSDALTDWGSTSVGSVTSACRGMAAAAAAARSRRAAVPVVGAARAAGGACCTSGSGGWDTPAASAPTAAAAADAAVWPVTLLLLLLAVDADPPLPAALLSETMLLLAVLLLLLLFGMVSPGAVSSVTLSPLAALASEAAYTPAAGAAEMSEAARTWVLSTRKQAVKQ